MAGGVLELATLRSLLGKGTGIPTLPAVCRRRCLMQEMLTGVMLFLLGVMTGVRVMQLFVRAMNSVASEEDR